MKNQKKNETETTNPWEEDCPTDCECYDEPQVQVGNNVYTNTNGGSGPSDHLKELLAKKDKKINELKIVQKK